MPCSRSADRPSTSSAKSSSSPRVPTFFESARERRELILEDHLRLVQQPADQRRLAVVHAAAGDEAQQALALVRAQVGFDVGVDERRRRAPSEVSLDLLLLHRRRLIVIDDAPLALGMPGQQHLLDDRRQRRRRRFRSRRSADSSRASGSARSSARASRPARAASGRRPP